MMADQCLASAQFVLNPSLLAEFPLEEDAEIFLRNSLMGKRWYVQRDGSLLERRSPTTARLLRLVIALDFRDPETHQLVNAFPFCLHPSKAGNLAETESLLRFKVSVFPIDDLDATRLEEKWDDIRFRSTFWNIDCLCRRSYIWHLEGVARLWEDTKDILLLAAEE